MVSEHPAAPHTAPQLLLHALSKCLSEAAGIPLLSRRCRCTGLSIGHNISMAVFGGTAPMMATALLQGTGDIASPAALLIVSAALTAVGALQLRRWRIR